LNLPASKTRSGAYLTRVGFEKYWRVDRIFGA
jgi:hypothetical protein